MCCLQSDCQNFVQSMNQKKKASNFTKAEIEVLVSEVEARKDLLFGKLSMSLTADMKREGWNGVAGKVSEVSVGEVRSAKSVKKKWVDMTSMLRKKEAARRREMNMTGGGECEQVVEEMPFVEQQVIGMLAVESIDGVAGGVDVGIECEQKGGFVTLPVVEDSASQQKLEEPVQSRKRVKGQGDMDEVLLIERRRLEVEQERLEVEKRRLEVEEKRLRVEEERLAFEREKCRYVSVCEPLMAFADE